MERFHPNKSSYFISEHGASTSFKGGWRVWDGDKYRIMLNVMDMIKIFVEHGIPSLCVYDLLDIILSDSDIIDGITEA